jgi:small subunit ribosomal protein S20
MADHPSAVKRNRQRLKRTARNRSVESSLKTTLKKAHGALTTAAADKKAAKEAAPLVQAAAKSLARAASKGVIHPRTAARKVSRLNTALHKAAAAK